MFYCRYFIVVKLTIAPSLIDESSNASHHWKLKLNLSLSLTLTLIQTVTLLNLVTGQLVDMQTRGLDHSCTGHLVDWSNCGLDNSRTGHSTTFRQTRQTNKTAVCWHAWIVTLFAQTATTGLCRASHSHVAQPQELSGAIRKNKQI